MHCPHPRQLDPNHAPKMRFPRIFSWPSKAIVAIGHRGLSFDWSKADGVGVAAYRIAIFEYFFGGGFVVMQIIVLL
jgi:hypothetical protein